MKGRLINTVFAAFVALTMISCGGNSPAGKKEAVQPASDVEIVTKVSVATAQNMKVPQTEVYSSTVMAYVTNNIVPQSGARIRKINVEVGDFVSEGQVLAEMDKLNLDQARLKLINDSTELSRVQGLYEAGGISKSDFEAIELAYKVSRSSFDNLMENTVLRSPINGVVTARNYDVGDMYSMASPIFVVQQITPVKLLVGISESDYTKVKRGDKVTVETEAIPGRSFTGNINRIYPTIEAASHTFQAEVIVSNANRTLRPGMYARVTVSFGENDSVVVPDAAVVKQQGSGQRSVFIVNEDNSVSSRIVTLGRHFGVSDFEILSGLEGGEKVVVKGQSSLKEGSKVEIID